MGQRAHENTMPVPRPRARSNSILSRRSAGRSFAKRSVFVTSLRLVGTSHNYELEPSTNRESPVSEGLPRCRCARDACGERPPTVGSNSGGEPEHETECPSSGPAKGEGPMGQPSMEIHRCRQVGQSGNCNTENTGDNEAKVPSDVKCDHVMDHSKQVVRIP